jgi:hypothetical protein
MVLIDYLKIIKKALNKTGFFYKKYKNKNKQKENKKR